MTNSLLLRRHFLGEAALGLGGIALHSLLPTSAAQAAAPLAAAHDPLAPRKPPQPARAKRVIFMFQGGGPSQLDLFDPKPMIARYNGQPAPASMVAKQSFAFIKPDAAMFSSPFRFSRHGQSGAELSELLPGLAKVADDVAFMRGMVTDAFNHAPGQIFMQTGAQQPGRPSLGAWATYGLGSESRDLPAFVVLSSGGGLSGGSGTFGAGFLPSVYQGVPFRRGTDPILALGNPRGISPEMQRDSIGLITNLDRIHLAKSADPEIATRIHSYETAFRMQTSGPELVDLSKETDETFALYGAERGKPSYALNCLLARRLIERDVRFVMLTHEAWDHHSEVVKGCREQTRHTDRGSSALVADLKQRGLLEDTLVIWGGEFGRTPMVESNSDADRSMGRDHHPTAFTMWMAGGGVKPGITIGKTDELGFQVVEDRIHVHDLHATILHLLGFDHTKLTFRAQGRDFRLTDVHGKVVSKLLA